MNSPVEEEFRRLLDEIRTGSPDAVRRFLDRYGGCILRVIRQKLDDSLRQAFDSVDFLQDVLASFFTAGRPRNFRDDEELLAYLVGMARNKVIDVIRRRLGTDRYNWSRERSLQGSAREAAMGVAADGPSPCEVVMSNEAWDRLLNGLPFHHRRILEMLRAGHTHQEIAGELGLTTKTVQRLVQKLTPKNKPS